MKTHQQGIPSEWFLASKISCCANSRNAQDDMGKDIKSIRGYLLRQTHGIVDNPFI